jgi:hypothetical protein
MNKILALSMIMLATSACTRVQTGEIGINKSINGEVSDSPVNTGLSLTIFDTIVVVDATQVRVLADNIKAKDMDGVLFSDIDVQATYNVESQGAIAFYKKTREVDRVCDKDNQQCDNVLGYKLVQQELINAVSKSINKFKANQVNTNKVEIEAAIKAILTEKLEALYPNAFDVTNVNLNSAQLDPSVERVLQAQALLESEKRLSSIKLDVQNQQTELLQKELEDMKTIAAKAGIAVKDLMHYRNTKEYNRVLSEFAKNNGNTQIQVRDKGE